MTPKNADESRQAVRNRYGQIAKQETSACGFGTATSCCGSAPVSIETTSQAFGYTKEQLDSAPEGANMGLGCGNPQAIASLKEGKTVLDLGSGGGFDCFLAAKSVGESGRIIGVDMTADMVSKARRNAEKLDARNVEFRLGEIEHLPVADASVDVILSNCVINLSPEKIRVFKEAWRVLKPGGRLAILDVVALQPLPAEIKSDIALISGCIGGTEQIEDIKSMLEKAGFEDINIQLNNESRQSIREWFPGRNLEDYVASATIEAVKPICVPGQGAIRF
ncbi:MAG: arsenite methyltransferase [Desulfobacterales bacterium]|nr:arsenite methyltransferase [Desulfobacterales bacterium]